MLRKFVDAAVQVDGALGERQIRVIANSGRPDRVGDTLRAAGCKLDNYLNNPIVLADHDPTQPIGNFAPKISGGALTGVITFAPKGVSAKADEYCGLYKNSVLRTVSVGFKPIDYEDNRAGGVDFLTWELLELSCVSVPCDPGAVVVQRNIHARALGVAPAIARVRAELDKAESCHAAALDFLTKTERHRAAAARHARRLADQADDGGETDPDDDPDADVELALAARRKRLIEVREVAGGCDMGDAKSRRRVLEARRFLNDDEDVALRRRMVAIALLAGCP